MTQKDMRLVEWRKEKTQVEAAELIGITHCYYCAIENGKKPISRKVAKRLAALTKKPYEWWLEKQGGAAW